jgi:propionyl-CoA carboxylase beta chain
VAGAGGRRCRQGRLDGLNITKRVDNNQNHFATPFVAAERGYFDEVIMPHSMRKRVVRALQMLRNKQLTNPWKTHDNIAL